MGKSYIGRHDGGLYQRFTDGTPLRTLSVDTSDLDGIGHYSAASGSEVYAVRTATSAVVRFNSDTGKFGSPIAPPVGRVIRDLEAASSGRLWIVTTDGNIFNYAPAP